MATKKKTPKASFVAAGGGLMDALNGIADSVGAKDSKTYRPVPTGINVLDYYNARYFQNKETQEWELFSGLPIAKETLFIGYTGAGKQQSVETIVQTPIGPRRFGDLVVGDKVFGRNGKPTTVTGIFPQKDRTSFKISFSDGVSTLAGPDHFWQVQSDLDGNWRGLTTAQIREAGVYDRNNGKAVWSIPMCEPVEYEGLETEFDPYAMGAIAASLDIDNTFETDWFNDFKLTDGSPLLDVVSNNRGVLFDLDPDCDVDSAVVTYIGPALSGRLPIPDQILYNSVDVRKDFLRGYLDAISVLECGRCRLTASGMKIDLVEAHVYPVLAALTRSLGGMCTYKQQLDGMLYIDTLVETPFAMALRQSTTNDGCLTRYITSIERAEDADQVCIMVDDPEHLYLTDDYIVTHNTTLAVQSAVELVLPYANGTVFHIDLENAWSKERTSDITGQPMDVIERKYRRITAMPLESIYAFIKRAINAKMEMMQDLNSEIWEIDPRTGERVPAPTVFIVDTVAALQSKQVLEENEEMGSLLFEAGAQAKANNAFAQRLAGLIGDPNITIMSVNHVRVDPGPSGGPPKAKRVQYLNQDETCPGGTGFPQFADYFLKMVPCESLTNKMDEGFSIPGKIIRCTIVKSRLSYDGRQFELVLTADGFSNAWTNLHFLKGQKALQGAGAHLFLTAPDGRTTKKFAQKHWEGLYEGDEEFREIADLCLLQHLEALVPTPGAMSAPDAVDLDNFDDGAGAVEDQA